MSSAPSVIGGSAQAESPEWMPASSMCSITPPRKSSSPSYSASTSISIASSRNRSTSTGCSGRDLGGPARCSRAARRRRRRSPCRGRRARTTGGRAPGSRSRRRSALASSNDVAVPCFGAGSPASASTRPNAPRSSARWIASGLVPDDRHARVLRALRQAERRLAAELHDHAGDRAGLLLGVRRPRGRPRASAARSRAGRRCRSRSRPSRGCS